MTNGPSNHASHPPEHAGSRPSRLSAFLFGGLFWAVVIGLALWTLSGVETPGDALLLLLIVAGGAWVWRQAERDRHPHPATYQPRTLFVAAPQDARPDEREVGVRRWREGDDESTVEFQPTFLSAYLSHQYSEEQLDDSVREEIEIETAKPIQRFDFLPRSRELRGDESRHFLRFDEYYELALAAVRSGEAILGPSIRIDDELAWWAATMRMNRHPRALKLSPSYILDRMTPERAARLESLPGWEWEGDDVVWRLMSEISIAAGTFSATSGEIEVDFLELHEFLDKRLPGWDRGEPWETMGFVYDDDVAEWVQGQLAAYSEGRLSPDQRHRLEQIPGWGEYGRIRHEVLARLAAGQTREDLFVKLDWTVPPGPERNLMLWLWARFKEHDDGIVDPELAAALEANPGWSWVSPRQVDRQQVVERQHQHLAYLQQYVEENGPLELPLHLSQPNARRQDVELLYDAFVAFEVWREGSDLDSDVEAKLLAIPGWMWVDRSDLPPWWGKRE